MCASFIISIIAAGFSILYQKNISTVLSSYYTKLFFGAFNKPTNLNSIIISLVGMP